MSHGVNSFTQFDAFRETLIHDLTADQFADMYAQTVAYGLFAARAQNPDQPDFSRELAVYPLAAVPPKYSVRLILQALTSLACPALRRYD